MPTKSLEAFLSQDANESQSSSESKRGHMLQESLLVDTAPEGSGLPQSGKEKIELSGALEIDRATRTLLIETMDRNDLKVDKRGLPLERYFNRAYVAGEISELGIDSSLYISPDDKALFVKDLADFRDKVKTDPDYEIGLVKYMYRLQQAGIKEGIDYPELTADERKRLEVLPFELRLHPSDGNLVYLPQLAKVLGKPLSEISEPEDARKVLEFLKHDLTRPRDDEETEEEYAEHRLQAILLSGTLADLSPETLRELITSDTWSDERWNEALALLEKYKKEGKGYLVARLLPAARKVEAQRKSL